MNQKARWLIELGFSPVLLGSQGESLKRPVLTGWQTAVYSREQVMRWPRQNNLGLRCGLQADGKYLSVFDFDHDAARIFPIWMLSVLRHLPHQPVVVTSGRGYHVYTRTLTPQPSQVVAARHVRSNGCCRTQPYIEIMGAGKQVVSAGSRHPSGRRYRFVGEVTYARIPTMSDAAYQWLLSLSRRFDQRPKPKQQTAVPIHPPPGVTDCLAYARQHIRAPERVEANGDIRFLGQGGLLITADGRGWYAFGDGVGGGLPELIAWHGRKGI